MYAISKWKDNHWKQTYLDFRLASCGELLLLNPLIVLFVLASKNNILPLRNNKQQNRNDRTTRESNTTNNENEIMMKFESDLQYAN